MVKCNQGSDSPILSTGVTLPQGEGLIQGVYPRSGSPLGHLGSQPRFYTWVQKDLLPEPGDGQEQHIKLNRTKESSVELCS